ncbi:MAG: sugar ABC transporter permease, partial [Chloroflexi bacterium]|nr:sugar ABC transporter permease [Chloroflexota bacterium]
MVAKLVPARYRSYLAETRSAYLFLLPSIVIFGVFMVYPMFYGLWTSFHRWSLLGDPVFIGGGNYTKLIADEEFWTSLRITTVYTVMFVPSITVIALIVAGALNGPIRFKGLLRSLYFVPIMSSAIIVALCFEWIYNGEVGILAFIMDLLGFSKIGVLGT